MSAIIPNLKSFLASFNTGFGHHDFAFTITNSALSGTRSGSAKPVLDFMPLRSIQSAEGHSNSRPSISLAPDHGRDVYEVQAARE